MRDRMRRAARPGAFAYRAAGYCLEGPDARYAYGHGFALIIRQPHINSLLSATQLSESTEKVDGYPQAAL